MKIISAGMYRSGSTYLFNAIRLLLNDPYSKFVHKANDYDKENEKEVHLIKCHKYLEWLSDDADLVFTIYRDIREVKESMERRKELATIGFVNETRLDLFDIYFHNYMLWVIKSNLIINYDDIINNPMKVVTRINIKLFEKGLTMQTRKRRLEIVEELKNMQPPEKGSDPITLLHENHFTSR